MARRGDGVTCAFRVLGPLEVLVDGRAVSIGSRKQRRLLTALVARSSEGLTTGAVLELLWDGAPPPSADVTVRSLVSRIRRVLGPAAGRLAARDGTYLLRTCPGEIDAECLTRLLDQGRAELDAGRPERASAVLRGALGLWRGPPLADLDDVPFAQPVCTRLTEALACVVEDLSAAELASGQPRDAITRLEQHVAAHPLRERAWEQLMLGLYRTGRQADALAAYRQVRAILRDELGVEPSPGLRRLERQVLRQDPRLDLARPRHAPHVERARHNLPAALTPLVGRADELSALTARLDGTRLLTLTGVGGVGKTRLALRLAADVLDRFEAVRLVELAPLERDDRVGAEVGRGLGAVPAAPGDALDRAADLVAGRRVLLVVDNCEHLLAGATRAVSELLRRCPRLVVVATSREPLGVVGEVVWPVPSLSLPPRGSSHPAELAESDAVRLFLQRAAAARVGFGLTEENAAAVHHICRRLDGIPLALELAASRLRALAAPQLAARLDDRFGLLTDAGRSALPRQQTLRAAMDWSYQLLTPVEQAALRALSVLVGDFDLDAAVAVIELAPLSGQPEELVFRLVDKSLIVARPRDGEMSYALLETVREYAAQRLAEAGEQDAARRRHREHYRRLVRSWRPFSTPSIWYRTVDEHNLQAALSSAIADGDGNAAQQLAGGLWSSVYLTGQVAEVVPRIEQALALDSEELAARADTMTGLAFLYGWAGTGPIERSTELFARARALADEAGDDDCRFRAYFFHSEILRQLGDRQGAVAALREAIRLGSGSRVSGAHHSLGWIEWGGGDLRAARTEFERAVESGGDNPWLRAHAGAALALVSAATGDHVRAAGLAEEAVAQARRLRPPGPLVMALLRATQTHLLGDGADAARTHLRELFALLQAQGLGVFRAEALEAAAVLAHRAGDLGWAERCLAYAGRIRGSRSSDRAGVDVLAPVLAPVRAAAASVERAEPVVHGEPDREGDGIAAVKAWLDTDGSP